MKLKRNKKRQAWDLYITKAEVIYITIAILSLIALAIYILN
ncbi:hypothetical protein [Psychroserpens burtonensis]|nr:hypothetical protein [Psychroserpens burtonensis]